MLHRHLPLITGIAIVVVSVGLSAMQLAPLYDEITNPSTKDASRSTSVDNRSEPPKKKQHNIAAFSMFGKFNQEQKAEPELKSIPKTKLRLTLTGVSATDNQDLARALVEGPDRSTESYKIGDSLPGNASLHSVHGDRIVLSRSGKLETLFFPETSTTNLIASVDTIPDYRDTEEPAYVQSRFQDIQIPQNTTRITGEQKKSIRDKLSALRAKLRDR